MGKYEPKTEPYPHQREAVNAAWGRTGYGFLMEMGTGKSKVIVDELSALWERGRIDTAVIFAPKGVYGNWPRKEIPQHMPDRVREHSHVHLWRGGGSATERRQLESLRRSQKLVILAVNIEAVSQSQRAMTEVRTFIEARRAVYIAVDEASTIKNPRAQRTKNLIDLGRIRTVAYRRIATGSPVPRGPLDLFSQFEFLLPQCLGFSSFYPFRARYAVTKKKQFAGKLETDERTGEIRRKSQDVEVVVAYQRIDELTQRVAQHAIVKRKEDCLSLPPKIFTTRDVELTPEQQRAYDELRDWAVTELDSGAFASVQAVITQLLRLHQISCGHVTDEQGVLHTLPSNRPRILQEIAEEAGDKIITWCQYRPDIERAAAALRDMGRRVVEYHGGTSTDDRSRAILEFQEGDADDFVGTPHAGGYGITLTRARTCVYYSNGYDLEKRMQSEDRAHRIGQEFPVTYVDMIARGTVDEKIIEALLKKQSIADMIMRGVVDFRSILTE